MTSKYLLHVSVMLVQWLVSRRKASFEIASLITGHSHELGLELMR